MHIRIQASLIGLVSGKNTGTSLYFNGQNPGFPVKISPRSPRCCSRKCLGRAGCSLASSPSHPRRANGRYIMEKRHKQRLNKREFESTCKLLAASPRKLEVNHFTQIIQELYRTIGRVSRVGPFGMNLVILVTKELPAQCLPQSPSLCWPC
jgi:hypothetical protein